MSSQVMVYPLVSVVVPAYNGETRIAYTLKSIIAQDYPNIEIIVVNDASTDATKETARCTLEGSGCPFLIIDHEVNRGETASRNTGLDAAKGEYIWFIDADDMAETNLVSTLYALIEKYECDLSFCGLKDRFDDGKPDVLFPIRLEAPEVRNGDELVWQRVFNKIVPHVCGMLFQKKFLLEMGLRFYEGCTAGGDVEFQLKAFCRAEKVAFTPECLYIYVHHAGMGSIRDNNTREKEIHRYQDNTDAQLRTAVYLSEHAPSIRIKELADKLLLPQALIRRLTLCAMMDDRARFDALLSETPTQRALSESKKFSLQKPEVFLKAFALLHFPDIYYRLRRK